VDLQPKTSLDEKKSELSNRRYFFLIKNQLSRADAALRASRRTVFAAPGNHGAGFSNECATRRAAHHHRRPGTLARSFAAWRRGRARRRHQFSDEPENEPGYQAINHESQKHIASLLHLPTLSFISVKGLPALTLATISSSAGSNSLFGSACLNLSNASSAPRASFFIAERNTLET